MRLQRKVVDKTPVIRGASDCDRPLPSSVEIIFYFGILNLALGLASLILGCLGFQ